MESSPNMTMDERSYPPRKSLALRALPWGLMLLAWMGLAWMYWNAAEMDPAIINVSTGATVCLSWLCVVGGLWLLGTPRSLWLSSFLLPILGLGIFFSLYRLERFDGELTPIFEERWRTPPPLPQVAESVETPPSRFAAGPNDYPQFLGPSRNGVLSHVRLDPDWQSRPPEVLWRVAIGDGWSGFAVQGNAAITMEQRDAQEWVSCYDIDNGNLLWKHEIAAKHSNPMGGTGPRSTPTIAKEKVYAMSAVSQLVCLDLATGELLWQQDLLELAKTNQADFERNVAWGRSASPLVIDNEVICSLGGAGDQIQTLIAFDAEDGQERWRGGTHQISYASPSLLTLQDQPQIAIIDEESLTAFSLDGSQELWSVPWPGSSAGSASVSQPVQIDNQRVLMSKGYGTGSKLIEVTLQAGAWKADVVWESSRSLRTKFTSAVVHAGYAYGLSDGVLECVDLANGERMWKKGRYQQGQLLLVNDVLLITSEAGEVALVSAFPTEYRELARLDVIGDVTWNTAALAGDRLLIRNSDEAACVRLPLLPSTSELPADESSQLQGSGA